MKTVSSVTSKRLLCFIFVIIVQYPLCADTICKFPKIFLNTSGANASGDFHFSLWYMLKNIDTTIVLKPSDISDIVKKMPYDSVSNALKDVAKNIQIQYLKPSLSWNGIKNEICADRPFLIIQNLNAATDHCLFITGFRSDSLKEIRLILLPGGSGENLIISWSSYDSLFNPEKRIGYKGCFLFRKMGSSTFIDNPLSKNVASFDIVSHRNGFFSIHATDNRVESNKNISIYNYSGVCVYSEIHRNDSKQLYLPSGSYVLTIKSLNSAARNTVERKNFSIIR